MRLSEVTNSKTKKEFLEVPKFLYRYDPVWVCPLDREIENRFNPSVNVYLQNGEAKRWVLKNERGELCGRISAFYSNKSRSDNDDLKSGGIGYFECINNQDAANLLFITAQKWLEGKGVEAMDGPINPGENDSNWGLLVDGFTHPGYGMPYNFPYYKDLFLNYGFKLYFEQYSYHLDLSKKFPERFWKIAEWVAQKPYFQFCHFKFSESKKFVNGMAEIYNKAWSAFKEDFEPLDPKVVENGMNRARDIIDEELIWFAFHKDEPIAFFIMFPDVNQILKHLNGKLNLINKLKFLYLKKTNKINRIRAMVAGVVPKYQNAGIESAIFWHLNQVMKHKPYYKEIELSWVGDFNPKMKSLYEAVGGQLAKKHITYRYIFNPNIPFTRFMPEALGNLEKIKRKKMVI